MENHLSGKERSRPGVAADKHVRQPGQGGVLQWVAMERAAAALPSSKRVAHIDEGVLVSHPNGGVTLFPRGTELTEDELQGLHQHADYVDRLLWKHYGNKDPVV